MSIELDDYEAVNLLWLLRVARHIGLDTGDWLGQLLFKLEARPCSMCDPNSPPRDTEARLDRFARSRLLSPEGVEALRWFSGRISSYSNLDDDYGRKYNAFAAALSKLLGER